METDIIVAAEIYHSIDANTRTLDTTVQVAQNNLQASGSSIDVKDVVADKGSYSANVLGVFGADSTYRTYIAEPQLDESVAHKAGDCRAHGTNAWSGPSPTCVRRVERDAQGYGHRQGPQALSRRSRSQPELSDPLAIRHGDSPRPHEGCRIDLASEARMVIRAVRPFEAVTIHSDNIDSSQLAFN